MDEATHQLLSVAGPALGPSLDPEAGSETQRIPSPLRALLSLRNGFYAFESALHVFATGVEVAPVEGSVEDWNAPALWRDGYGPMAEGHFFFAEDLFGGQFSLKDGHVYSFDPETGTPEWLADDILGWTARILDDYEVLTGYPLAHAWQSLHGRLVPGQRLMPKQPFVLGGEFTVENLYALDAVDGMRLRAGLAMQLRDLPDGAKVQWRVVD
jgi:outer membrane protein assembly factor BamB